MTTIHSTTLNLFGLFLPLTLAIGCVSPGLEGRVQALEREADRQAVTRLMYAYAHGIDGFDEALLRTAFAEDAVAEYKGVNFPMDLRLEGIDAIVEWLKSSVGHRKEAAPWHYMSTALVEVGIDGDKDRATLKTFQHNRTMSGVGVYSVEARRTPGGWRIAKLHLDERLLDAELLESMDDEAGRDFPIK